MVSTSYAPCPKCRALNMGHRRCCWKCSAVFSASFAIDAQRYATAERARRAETTEVQPVQKETPEAEGREGLGEMLWAQSPWAAEA